MLIEYPRIEAEKATYEVHEYPDLIRLKMQKPEASSASLSKETSSLTQLKHASALRKQEISHESDSHNFILRADES